MVVFSTRERPTPLFLPGRFHGHRSLAGYSPWGHKELDTTELSSISYIVISWDFEAYTCLVELLSHVQQFCDPMDCSVSDSSVHGISQARILEWVAIFFSNMCLRYLFSTSKSIFSLYDRIICRNIS